jgi:hypothetical protein
MTYHTRRAMSGAYLARLTRDHDAVYDHDPVWAIRDRLNARDFARFTILDAICCIVFAFVVGAGLAVSL